MRSNWGYFFNFKSCDHLDTERKEMFCGQCITNYHFRIQHLIQKLWVIDWDSNIISLLFFWRGEAGHLGGISSSVLSVFFTDNCYKLLKSLHLIGWEQICQWKTLTKCLRKCPPWSSVRVKENKYDFMLLWFLHNLRKSSWIYLMYEFET